MRERNLLNRDTLEINCLFDVNLTQGFSEMLGFTCVQPNLRLCFTMTMLLPPLFP